MLKDTRFQDIHRESPAPVRVFTVSGIEVASLGGSGSIDSLAPGVYVVESGADCVKITVK